MALSGSKVLVLGALVGAAGVSLVVVWYQSWRGRRRGSIYELYLGTNKATAAGAAAAVVGGEGECPLRGGQVEILERLEALIRCVSELKDEVGELKNALPVLQGHVRDELRGGRSGAEGGPRRASPLNRTTPTRRRRTTAAGPGARAEGHSSEEAESEGGYMTAFTDTEDEEKSESGPSGEEEEPVNELSALLERIDCLHKGNDTDKRACLATLLEKREEFGQNSLFLWRLVRAYSDLHDITSSLEEKKTHAETGKDVGEEAVRLNPLCADSHQWYAIMCGIIAEYETVQNRIKIGYIFKDHLDKAIELKPQDPLSYYLLGRWCYAVAQLSWIERRVAATLFGEPPSATVQDALKHFLKVEEIRPKYSKLNYVFLAKCYKDLGQKGQARSMLEAACSMETVSKEDGEAQKELDSLLPALGV